MHATFTKIIFNTLCIFSFCFGSFTINAQGEVINSTKLAIKMGSSKELAKSFGEMIEISFDGEKSNYSRTQAEFVMKDFFSKNTPLDFQYAHQGASKEGLKYAIGNYKASTGSFRVYILIKQSQSGTAFIDTIDFSRQ